MRGPHYNNKCPRATTRTQRRYSVRAARVAAARARSMPGHTSVGRHNLLLHIIHT